MSEHADIIAVQYQYGATALVWLDLVTGTMATNHTGLREMLRRGVRDWAGLLIEPRDGHQFLSAVYDHFFLNGYPVRWLSASGLKGIVFSTKPTNSGSNAAEAGTIVYSFACHSGGVSGLESIF